MDKNRTGKNLQSSNPIPRRLAWSWTLLLGIYLVAWVILLAYLVLELWPTLETDLQGNPLKTEVSLFGGFISFGVTGETSLILLVMVAGAMGSYVHAATSFVTYVGNRRLTNSWVWWYILRTFVGIALSLIFYFVIRGGLLSAGAATGDLNPFGFAAISGLVGLCSKQATDKLVEVFDTLFKTKPGAGDDERVEKLVNPEPTITAIKPASVKAGIGEVSITVSGSGFVEESVVRLNGTDRTTNFETVTRLTAQLSAEDTSSPGSLKVTVFTPPPGGGSSDPVKLTVQ